ncbi:hypothetical protein T265_11775 [Opisthorchis viverrini]|uniref:Uncharacterized protein n=1 Tax=Opisthorchis viverrini TaxID=6198 RepID=A0A074YXR0_OPIVI|nr:hypothetical protein T265_11775 [Opisthorchis viverrini]KER19458.1 hypothetical protein T265_11775 [Opisthorchis viverrini]
MTGSMEVIVSVIHSDHHFVCRKAIPFSQATKKQPIGVHVRKSASGQKSVCINDCPTRTKMGLWEMVLLILTMDSGETISTTWSKADMDLAKLSVTDGFGSFMESTLSQTSSSPDCAKLVQVDGTGLSAGKIFAPSALSWALTGNTDGAVSVSSRSPSDLPSVALFRSQTMQRSAVAPPAPAASPEGSTWAEILSGCPILRRSSQDPRVNSEYGPQSTTSRRKQSAAVDKRHAPPKKFSTVPCKNSRPDVIEVVVKVTAENKSFNVPVDTGSSGGYIPDTDVRKNPWLIYPFNVDITEASLPPDHC